MSFNSVGFFVFLIIVLCSNLLLRRHETLQRLMLLVACYYFYGQWGWSYCVLILTTTTVDFIVARKIFRGVNPRLMLTVSLVVNLGILVIFKYANFFISTANTIWGLMGTPNRFGLWDVLMPIGISFYTFKSLSYVIDVYRGDTEPRGSFLDYALYVSFFAHLAAGPIVRAKNFIDQLSAKARPSFVDVQQAVGLILFGLVKKMVIADNLATIVTRVFDSQTSLGAWGTLIGVYAFTFQIYFDFSGYSDIAIGISKLFGINIPKNFDLPYLSTSFQEFWRRWHISLSTWLRDYLYISVGGSRHGNWRTVQSLTITMLLGGLWHGASWNFILWGGLHAAYLAIERQLQALWPGFWKSRSYVILTLRFLITFNVVAVTWIFFRSASFANTVRILHNLTDFSGHIPDGACGPAAVFLFTLIGLHWLSGRLSWQDRLKSMTGPMVVATYTVGLVLLVVFNANVSAPFIYFKF